MLGIITVFVVIASSVWVYLDATKYKIGKISDEKSTINNSAGEWAVACLLIWLIAFPFYLYNRKKLIQKAQEFPVEATGRVWKTVCLSVLGGVVFFISAVAYITTADHSSQQNPSSSLSLSQSEKPLPQPAPVETETEYIASAQALTFSEGKKGIYYKEFLKNPHKHQGLRLNFTAKIFDIEEYDGRTAIQAYISRNYENVVIYFDGITKLYKDDIVNVYGEGAGVFEGKNAFGATIRVPQVNAKYLKKVRSDS